MNIILNPLQSNTKKGDIVLPAYADLTGKENYLVKVVNDSGTAKFALPAATDDLAVYVLASGTTAGGDSAAESPSENENCGSERLRALWTYLDTFDAQSSTVYTGTLEANDWRERTEHQESNRRHDKPDVWHPGIL